MKAFVISLCIIVSIYSLTIFNAIYINNEASSLIEMAKKLDPQTEEVQNFIDEWEGVQFFFRISSSHKETHRIDEVLNVLLTKANIGTKNGFYEDRASLVEFLTQIKEDETLSLDSII